MTQNFHANEVNTLKQENSRLLKEFGDWMESRGLSRVTSERHLELIDLYINRFLLNNIPVKPKDGWDFISDFLGFWLIRKDVSASEDTLRKAATSLKKFYHFLFERGEISEDDLTELKEIISEEMPEWLSALRAYEENIES